MFNTIGNNNIGIILLSLYKVQGAPKNQNQNKS